MSAILALRDVHKDFGGVEVVRGVDLEIETGRRFIEEVRRLVPGRSMQSRPLLYARVDLVVRGDRPPLLMELELVEPALYTQLAPGSLDRLASAILREVAYGADPNNDASAV